MGVDNIIRLVFNNRGIDFLLATLVRSAHVDYVEVVEFGFVKVRQVPENSNVL
jgi:hypothetical protein